MVSKFTLTTKKKAMLVNINAAVFSLIYIRIKDSLEIVFVVRKRMIES